MAPTKIPTTSTTTSYFINAFSNSIHYSWNLINFTTQFSMPKQFTDQTLFMCAQQKPGFKFCILFVSQYLAPKTLAIKFRYMENHFFFFGLQHNLSRLRLTRESSQLIILNLIAFLCYVLPKNTMTHEIQQIQSKRYKTFIEKPNSHPNWKCFQLQIINQIHFHSIYC